MKKLILMLTATLALALGARAESDMDTLRVYFDPNQTTVTEFQQSLIDIFLKTHYSMGDLVVAGHADAGGDPLLNLDRSRDRALMVANYLLTRGIGSDRIRLETWGETRPVVPNTTLGNRTRNRRVEIVGIPYSTSRSTVSGKATAEVALADGSLVPIRDMTADGRPRRVFTVVLRKSDELRLPDTTGTSFRRPGCGGVKIVQTPCAPRPIGYQFTIRVDSNLRCPSKEVWVGKEEQTYFDGSNMDRKHVFAPVRTETGQGFLIPVENSTECDSLDYRLGKGCYTLHPARIVFEGMKVNFLKGRATPMQEVQTGKAHGDGSYTLLYTNKEPGSLQLTGQVIRGKQRKLGFKNVRLDRLNYDAELATYIVTKRSLKRLRKH